MPQTTPASSISSSIGMGSQVSLSFSRHGIITRGVRFADAATWLISVGALSEWTCTLSGMCVMSIARILTVSVFHTRTSARHGLNWLYSLRLGAVADDGSSFAATDGRCVLRLEGGLRRDLGGSLSCDR